MPASYPFRFFGRAPLVTLTPAEPALGYELHFVTEPTAPQRDRIAEAFERALVACRQIGASDAPWRWVRSWARFEITPRHPDAIERCLDELADLLIALHAVQPIVEVIFAGRIAGWPKRLHPWDEFTRRRGEPPGPPFASYRRLGYRGENLGPPRDETDPHFERARATHRRSAREPQPKVAPPTGPPPPRFKAKDRVLAYSDGWYDGHIVDAMPDQQWRVHFAGYEAADDRTLADRFVIPYPTGEPLQLAKGARVVVESEGSWYDAVVIKVISPTRWLVHYAGWDERTDEEVSVRRIAPR